MATQRMSIMTTLSPDETGRAFFEPYNIKATNDLFRHLVGIMNDPSSAQEHGFYGQFPVPKNYVGSPQIIAVWTSSATTGNARIRVRYRAVGGNDTESLDQASFQETVAVTDAAPSAAHERMEAAMALTAGNLAVDDTVTFYFTRLDDSAVDTLANGFYLHDLIFEYADA